MLVFAFHRNLRKHLSEETSSFLSPLMTTVWLVGCGLHACGFLQDSEVPQTTREWASGLLNREHGYIQKCFKI